MDTQDEICDILTSLETKFEQDKLEEVYNALFSCFSMANKFTVLDEEEHKLSHIYESQGTQNL